MQELNRVTRRSIYIIVSGWALVTNSSVVGALSASRGPVPYRPVSLDAAAAEALRRDYSLRVTASLRVTT